MRKLLLFVFMSMFLAGCGVFQPKPEPVVVVEHVLVMPPDNLLVDCDIQAPPARADYLRDFSAPVEMRLGTAVPAHALGLNAPSDALERLTRALKNAQGQLQLQNALNLKHYQNQDVCNQRWAKLREHKANAAKELTNRKKE